MIKDLLFISKDLLYCLNKFDFTEEERNYILSVIEKIIDLIMVELES